jgi:hypothetical protein
MKASYDRNSDALCFYLGKGKVDYAEERSVVLSSYT